MEGSKNIKLSFSGVDVKKKEDSEESDGEMPSRKTDGLLVKMNKINCIMHCERLNKS
jgi:hypothetical protein